MKGLTGKQKARMITLAVIVLYLLYGTLAYAWEIRMKTPQIDTVDSMQIDGSEFAGIANLFVAGTNEGILPKNTTDTGILVDRDRRQLKDMQVMKKIHLIK